MNIPSLRSISVVILIGANPFVSFAQTNPITAPFQDFNLIRDEIPQVLLEAQRERYPDIKEWTCEMISERRTELTKILGPDEQEEKNKDLNDRASEAVQKALVDTTTGWIPFRGWIRKLTGAERHAQKAANAWEAGLLQAGVFIWNRTCKMSTCINVTCKSRRRRKIKSSKRRTFYKKRKRLAG